MKSSPSVTALLSSVRRLIEQVDRVLQSRALQVPLPNQGLVVTFYHDITSLECVGIRWSDRPLSSDSLRGELSYEYRITSSGIHFTAYAEQAPGSSYWSAPIRHWSGAHDDNMRLVDVPNKYKPGQTMYEFHQEKIRETLSGLPAWATVVWGD